MAVVQKLDTSLKLDEARHYVPKKMKPIWGYRFVINGDFNGDGKTDTLVEHYLSWRSHKEIPKFYDSLDYDQLVGHAQECKGICVVICKDTAIVNLVVGHGFLGLSFLKNEGDLDGDGSDEISFVANSADWSAVNSYHLLTYKDRKWMELLYFETRDYMIPEPPTVEKYSSMWGDLKLTDNNSENRTSLKKMKNFRGYITRLGNGKIKIHYVDVDDPFERDRIINLRKIPYKFRESRGKYTSKF